jgi:hypothetical protein
MISESLEIQSDENYVLVFSDPILKERDTSIFTINEWKYLIEISLYFESAVRLANRLSDSEYICDNKNKQFIDAAYFFYYCDYCHYETPKELQWIYLKCINFRVQDQLVSNKLRDWLHDNNQKIDEYLAIIKQYGIKVEQYRLNEELLGFNFNCSTD